MINIELKEVGIPLKKENGENLKCECGGIYRWDGTIFLSYPPQYNFYCEDCGDRIRMGVENLFPERYPELKKKLL